MIRNCKLCNDRMYVNPVYEHFDGAKIDYYRVSCKSCGYSESYMDMGVEIPQ